MFWDGDRWVPDRPPVVAAPSSKPRRHRDWLATGVMLVALIGLIVPIMGVSAGTNNGRILLSRWNEKSDVTVQQDTSGKLSYRGDWFNAYYPDYLRGQVSATDEAGASVSLRFRGAAVSWIGPTGPTRGTAKVFIDGEFVTTVDLWTAAFRPTRVLFKKVWQKPDNHKIRIE